MVYLLTLLLISIYISITDVTSRVISNRILLTLGLVQVLLLLIYDNSDILSASFVLIIGSIVYLNKIVGAGDIKYAVVLSLSLPLELLPSALLLTMLAGGVLASFYLLLNLARRIKANVNGRVDDSQYNAGIPYGVAISVGFYVMIFSHWVNYI